ncbi:MAG: hypothetical protein ACYDDF_07315 [Thermoplasmatota archaeon]
MRNAALGIGLTALLLVATFGARAAPGPAVPSVSGSTPNDTADNCKRDNAISANSCIETPAVAGLPTFYIDTGRADGRAGIWQESNAVSGLQKEPTFDKKTPDTSLLD